MSVAETVDPFTAVFGDQVKQRERGGAGSGLSPDIRLFGS